MDTETDRNTDWNTDTQKHKQTTRQAERNIDEQMQRPELGTETDGKKRSDTDKAIGVEK